MKIENKDIECETILETQYLQHELSAQRRKNPVPPRGFQRAMGVVTQVVSDAGKFPDNLFEKRAVFRFLVSHFLD